ncbi:hypothetical protein OG225_07130 [Nocardia sp. NBC_01377]|uniref:hypothetical protein n=1 Tax=Nocardia sp. NBC_01377 TaxID=2903595 RepID=UPI00324F2505
MTKIGQGQGPADYAPTLRLVAESDAADPAIAAADAALERYFAAADADNTVRTYDSVCRDYIAWCEQAGLAALPATPRTVARYLSQAADDTERNLSANTIRVWRAAISKAHRTAGLPDPTTDPIVTRVVKGIGIDRAEAGRTLRQAPPATLPIIQTVVTAIHADGARHDSTWCERVAARRDIALIVLLYAAALRGDEAVDFTIGDLRIVEGPDGDDDEQLRIRLRGSKTSRGEITEKFLRRGTTDALWCPWCALLRWLDVLIVHDDATREARKYLRHKGIDDEKAVEDTAVVAVGKFVMTDHTDPHEHRCDDIDAWPTRHLRAPLFRPLYQGGHPRPDNLTVRSLRRILTARGAAAGVGLLSGTVPAPALPLTCSTKAPPSNW